MIWWVWDAWNPPLIHTFNVVEAANDPYDQDVAWLGESAWTNRTDNTTLGLRTAA